MARLARIGVPNVPHHVTQRGNRSSLCSLRRRTSEPLASDFIYRLDRYSLQFLIVTASNIR